jgi:hypothetical protein
MAIFTLPVFAKCQQYDFELDIVTNDTLFDFPLNNGISVDDSNNIHIVWRKNQYTYPAHRSIYYSKRYCKTEDWSTPCLISDTAMESEAQCMAIDKNTGTVHVVYISYPFENPKRSKIIHAYHSSNDYWTFETVQEDTLEQGYEYPYMAVDANNYVHLMWAGYASSGLKRIYYSTNISGNWETQILNDSSYNYLLCDDCVRSISVTSNGIAYIAFLAMPDQYHSFVRIAHNNVPNGKSWCIENIETPDSINHKVFISIKNDSLLHLLYSCGDPYFLTYGCYYTNKELNGSWNDLELINGKFTSSMLIDKNGKVHLLQVYGTIGHYYTTNVSGEWIDTVTFVNLEMPGSKISLGSIGLTKQNKPCFIGSLFNEELDEIVVIRKSDHCDTTNSISTPEIIMNQVVVFPNPMNNTSIIKFNNPRQEEFEIKLFDFSGQLVRRIKSMSNEEVVINKGNLNSGIYFFYLTNNFKTRYSGKLLIK